jgi:hypothetical protein
MAQDTRIIEILREAKKLAQEYRGLTGKPLGITGEVAEYEAARILGLELTTARQTGYDALEKKDGSIRRLQVKGRCLLPDCKPGQRLGSIDITKEWDAVLMVLGGRTLGAWGRTTACASNYNNIGPETASFALWTHTFTVEIGFLRFAAVNTVTAPPDTHGMPD